MNIKDFGRFNLFWRPADESGAKLSEGGAMAYELRASKDKKKLQKFWWISNALQLLQKCKLQNFLFPLWICKFFFLKKISRSDTLVQLRLGNWDQSESHPVSVHKVFPDQLKLLPKEKKILKFWFLVEEKDSMPSTVWKLSTLLITDL